jgi:Domain of unknown function (DUF1857)
MISYTENISLSLEAVWEHFIFKIEHPENFVPGVSNVQIIEKAADYVIRSMDLVNPEGHQVTLLEKITFSPYWVKFSILEHPIYEGFVDNLAEAVSENETRITYSLHWVNKMNGEVFSNEAMIKGAVQKSIAFMNASH